MITATLRDAGFQVVAEATDGLEAVEAVKLHQPDLVLLDLLMPLARRHRRRPPDRGDAPETVIVMLTGARDETAALRGLRAGAVGS